MTCPGPALMWCSPRPARQLRQAREAQRQLDAGDIEVDPPNLPAYDELAG